MLLPFQISISVVFLFYSWTLTWQWIGMAILFLKCHKTAGLELVSFFNNLGSRLPLSQSPEIMLWMWLLTQGRTLLVLKIDLYYSNTRRHQPELSRLVEGIDLNLLCSHFWPQRSDEWCRAYEALHCPCKPGLGSIAPCCLHLEPNFSQAGVVQGNGAILQGWCRASNVASWDWFLGLHTSPAWPGLGSGAPWCFTYPVLGSALPWTPDLAHWVVTCGEPCGLNYMMPGAGSGLQAGDWAPPWCK